MSLPAHPRLPSQPRHLPAPLQQQRGVALVVSLVLLLVVTMLGLSMFRDLGLQEKIAGNTRDKQRSFQAAQSTLQFGEWWLNHSGGGTGSACAGSVDANNINNMQVCSNPLPPASSTTLPWANRFDYTPANMTVLSGGGLTQANANGIQDINYAKQPSLYISYLGLDPTGNNLLYQVTAVGYGGTGTGVSVVQSTYALKSGSTSLDGL